MSEKQLTELPILLEKVLHDAGLDLIVPAPDGAFMAHISGTQVSAWLSPSTDGFWLAFPIPNGKRLGLQQLGGHRLPPGMSTIGKVDTTRALYQALHTACVLQLNTPTRLTQRVEERLAAIAATERTQEVRRRIGQDVYREALFELWDGRCAVTGAKLPSELLRASHAKPWADATDEERLDPFNGLLLAVHLDALFDSGLLSFDDEGHGTLSPKLSIDARQAMGLPDPIQVTGLAPGHLPYLRYHRTQVAKP